ncbi:hypothetical protein BJ912DRAFT_464296 [Pholiota molesta]|nr:hypothetical protein BJ912DRAFT_464296 [Pholiota molesta]
MAAPAMQSASALVLTSNRPSLGVVDARQDSTLMTSDRGVAAQSTAVLGRMAPARTRRPLVSDPRGAVGWRAVVGIIARPRLCSPSAADLHRLAQRQRTSCPTTPRDDLRKRSRYVPTDLYRRPFTDAMYVGTPPSRTNDSVGRRSAADESSWASKRTGMGGGRRLVSGELSFVLPCKR